MTVATKPIENYTGLKFQYAVEVEPEHYIEVMQCETFYELKQLENFGKIVILRNLG